jgi:hypothetical protein
MNHRSNKAGFRASGGNVKPPSKGCLVLVAAPLAAVIAAGTAFVELI